MTTGGKSETEGLLPCPFCGGRSLGFIRPCTDGGLGVICHTCHTTMDSRVETEAEAITAWNRRAPQPEREGPSRDELIALIMDETTDDVVADGWQSLGKPNVLVQGCRFLRRADRARPTEGYENPEASARQFAGFIADRMIARFTTPATPSESEKEG